MNQLSSTLMFQTSNNHEIGIRWSWMGFLAYSDILPVRWNWSLKLNWSPMKETLLVIVYAHDRKLISYWCQHGITSRHIPQSSFTFPAAGSLKWSYHTITHSEKFTNKNVTLIGDVSSHEPPQNNKWYFKIAQCTV